MPPNTIEIPLGPETETVINGINNKPQESPVLHPVPRENYLLEMVQSTASLFAHILIGTTLAISYLFAFRNGLPLGSTPMHIVLCVTGYHLLMAQAILSLSPQGGWYSGLTLKHRRVIHWILQIAGSSLAIGGTIHKILDKDVHFNTLHGIFGLIALVFTTICLVNGLTSLYAFELRKFLPSNLSKITHICCGIIAFGAASVSLCFGFDKGLFRSWATSPLTDTFIAFVAILTFIIVFNPLISFFKRGKVMIKG